MKEIITSSGTCKYTEVTYSTYSLYLMNNKICEYKDIIYFCKNMGSSETQMDLYMKTIIKSFGTLPADGLIGTHQNYITK